MKLYKVICRGMVTDISGTQVAHGNAYVIAKNPEQAYQTLRKDLDNRKLGFSQERELFRVELLAEDAEYPDCRTRLYLPKTTISSNKEHE